MARKCDICGKGPQFGHRVSHAHNLTNRRFNPNVHKMRILINGKPRRINICTSCLSSGKVQKA